MIQSPFGKPALLVATLALAGAASAQRAPIQVPAGEPLVLRSWDTTKQMPQNSVTAVLQRRDGMVWAATFGGLCRFDGTSWQVHDATSHTTFADSRILALLEAADGSLWFGTELGAVSRLHRGKFESVASMTGGPVLNLMQLPDGRILCSTVEDLFVYESGRFVPFAAEALPRVVFVVMRGKHDYLIATQQHALRWRDRQTTVAGQVRCECGEPGDADEAWLGCSEGLFRWSGDALTPFGQTTGLAGEAVHATALTRDRKRLWFGTDRGLSCLWLDGSRAPLTMLSTAAVSALHEDAMGGIWVGFIGGGLVRLSPCEAVGIRIGDANGRAIGACSVVPDGHDSWLVGTNEGLFRVQRGLSDPVRVGDPLPVHGLLREGDVVWLGGDDGITKLQGDAVVDLPAPPNLGPMRALCRWHDGALLVGTNRGVFQVGATWERWQPAAPLDETPVKMLVPGAGDSLWLAATQSVIQVDRNGRLLRHLRRGVELPNAEVRAVLPGRGDRTWFGTYGGGFVGIGSRGTTVVGPAQGLPDAYVCLVAPIAAGWILGGNRGPCLVDPVSLDDFADGLRPSIASRHLQCTDNISSEANGGVQPSSATDGESAVLCSIGGIHWIEAQRLRRNLPPLVCHAEPMLAGDQSLERTADGTRVVARENREIQLACIALEFDRPESVRYRWRLGADGDWSEATSLGSLSVSVPDPGDFVIEIDARSDGDRRAESPARVLVRITPRVWERPLVQWSAGFTAALLVLAGVRFGGRRAARHAERLQSLVDDRTRELTVARDSLELRVEQRTAELQQALTRLAADHQQRELLERELDQMRRMESLGQLAGSVAHDFNNLLTVVLGNVELLQHELAGRGEVEELTHHIRDAATRGREITQRLLAMASRQTVVPTVIDLADVLRAHLSVLRDLMGGSILVECEILAEPLPVLATAGQIDQILMNLAVNARDAMTRGGVLRLRAEGTPNQVKLRVQDTGVGMSPEVRKRAFEPFFTTKGGHGTGLGLATVYGITKQLRGEVTIDSASGQGTAFTFTFPRAGEVKAVPVPVAIPRAEGAGKRARVLLIEDEPGVRRAVCRLLEVCGYEVVGEAPSGGDAVHWLAEQAGAIDVVLSDVSMPGLQGIHLVRALHGIRPGLPILFMSGHSSSTRLLQELAPLGIEMIMKPLTREDLTVALDRALAMGSSSAERS